MGEHMHQFDSMELAGYSGELAQKVGTHYVEHFNQDVSTAHRDAVISVPGMSGNRSRE
jgi:hypothetical protein